MVRETNMPYLLELGKWVVKPYRLKPFGRLSLDDVNEQLNIIFYRLTSS